ncbi:MAG: acetolactate synthase small subunit [Acidimicrobiia bacterium]|nr:acetolactate synthase small subunit [Acidimicrobiia bacterium]
MTQHIISVLVEDKAGVLARISSMFARRGFNIHSLAVGPSFESGMSRMTVVVEAPELEQVVKQLRKLVNTIKVTEFSPGDAVEREVMLLRVSAPPAGRAEILDAAGAFSAAPVDIGAASIAFEITGTPTELADFLELMRPYGIVELVKSGRVAIARDAKGGARSLKAAV